MIAGIGRVSGRECMIVANDATVKGGTYYPITVKKHLRAQEIAGRTGCRASTWSTPVARSCRARTRCSPDREHFGRIFYNQATMSRRRHPADRRRARLVHRGRRVRAGDERRGGDRAQPGHDLPRRPAAGEGRDRRGGDRRGARRRRPAHQDLRRHRPSGRRRPRRAADRAPTSSPPWAALAPAVGGDADRRPGADQTELYDVVPVDPRVPYDVHEVIARIVDGGEFAEFKADYGSTLVTGFARIHGHPVGIVANNGVLFSESALKGAHFIELCDKRTIPLLFLQNITGFMVGRDYEAGGIAKHGAKMVTAVACAGAEADRRHRRLLRRRQLLDVRAGVFAAVPVDVAQRPHLGDGRRAGRLGAGHRPRRDDAGEEEEEFKAPIREQYEHQGNPYYSTARLWDDGVIDPGRHQNRSRAGAFGGRPGAARAGLLRRVPDVTAMTSPRVSTPFWSPTAARSPCASSARCARWVSARSPCSATPTPAPATSPRPTSRSASGRPRTTELPRHRRRRRAPGAPARRRSIPATGSFRRTPNSLPRCIPPASCSSDRPSRRSQPWATRSRRRPRCRRSACPSCRAFRGRD